MLDITKEELDKLKKKIGLTPIVDFGNHIYGKVEGYNPAGSIKDRAAFYIIKEALESGQLKEDGAIIESTSGNTGIGLAYISQELGIKCIIVMPDSMSEERRAMIKAYGAELVLTPAVEGMAGAVNKAQELVKEKGYFFANQFGNVASIHAHEDTTGPEIFMQIPSVKYIVAGLGSGGTVMGLTKYIKDNNKDCSVVTVEPDSSPLLSKGYAGAHKIQGIGANFVPDLVDKKELGLIITVDNDEAIKAAKTIYDLTNEKSGISSGAAYVAALKLRKKVDGDILVILPDNGDRYPSSLYI